MKTYHIITYGCQMNWSDSERIAGYLKKNNLQPADLASADLVILNLCSVRQTAVNRVWGKLDDIRKKNPKAKIILTGCVLVADKNKFEKHADYILDIKNLDNWLNKINNQQLTTNNKDINYFSILPNYNSKFIAYVPIMTGCNNFCSYCVVPFTRGREVSRPAEEIISEVNKLVVQGYKLIILLGQNVNSYVSQISNFQFPISNKISKFKFQKSKVNFPQLLKLVNSIPGDYWLSFITSHPKDMSGDLIKCFKNCQHLIPYLHLPLQAGSDKILKAMNRKYDSKKYLNLIRKIRRSIRNISISTDIIVGFPNETKQDFQKTANLMKSIKFDLAYLAEYSPRAGTASAKLKDSISAEEKTQRRVALNEILKKTALENNKKMVGKNIEVLIERNKSINSNKSNKSNNDIIYFGKTRNFKDIKISANSKQSTINNLIGKIVKTKIIKAGPWSLEGKLEK
ncbi:MAG: tRNA (N6-isopentenyl adenosine(37)-C2)-methylthiotransferase MiaB [Patescibacteria group bacterium]|nr:tRNA (N6-isopentenyl adenosine(37)-C2)-methylthiotransferase MiaB [Patescibacteria group bacterium]